MASSSYTSLCSSPPLQTRPSPKQIPSLCCLLKLNQTKSHQFLATQITFCNAHLAKPSILVVKASKSEAQANSPGEEEKFEEYEVELVQPYGLRFAKGRDGGTYIDAIAPGGSADKTGLFTVGDKVLATRYLFNVPYENVGI